MNFKYLYLFILFIFLMNSANADVPFLDGYPHRQNIILNTDGITLAGNITNDHTIPVFISPANTSFWNNESFGTGNGITFTKSDGQTELNFEWEQFNSTTKQAVAHVLITDTFSSSTDMNIYVYYGGLNADNTDGASSYSAIYNAVFNLSTYTDATGTYASTETGTLTYPTGKIANALNIVNDVSYIDTNSLDFDSGTGTITAWLYYTGSDSYSRAITDRTATGNYLQLLHYPDEDHSGAFGLTILGDSAIDISILETAPHSTWTYIVYTWDGSEANLYMNAVLKDTDALGGTWTANSNMLIGCSNQYNTQCWNGSIDGVKFSSTKFSLDEIKLIYNADNNTLISFSSAEPTITDANITINIFDSLSLAHLTAVTLDFNVNAYDTSGNSPITINDINVADYSVLASKFGYDSNTITLSVSTNADFNIFLTYQPTYTIDFNILNVNTSAHITAVTLDFNVNVYDTSGNSPITISDINSGYYSIDVSADNYDTNSVIVNIDANGTAVIYMTLTPLTYSDLGYERYFNPYDSRQDLIDKNKFVNPLLVSEESGVLRVADQQTWILTGILILFGVVIIMGIYILFFKRGRK